MQQITIPVIAAALVTILAWFARTFWGVELPADVQGALTVLAVAVGAALIPQRYKAAWRAVDDYDASLDRVTEIEGQA